MNDQEDFGDISDQKPQINERVELRKWAVYVLSKRYHEALHSVARMVINILNEDNRTFVDSLLSKEQLEQVAKTGDFVKRVDSDDNIVLD